MQAGASIAASRTRSFPSVLALAPDRAIADRPLKRQQARHRIAGVRGDRRLELGFTLRFGVRAPR